MAKEKEAKLLIPKITALVIAVTRMFEDAYQAGYEQAYADNEHKIRYYDRL